MSSHWWFIETADRSPGKAEWVEVMMHDGTVHVAHYAFGGGEEQPPYEGWFVRASPVWGQAGYTQIPTPDLWRRIKRAHKDS